LPVVGLERLEMVVVAVVVEDIARVLEPLAVVRLRNLNLD
jgi:hypothetical protein